jgi:phage tail sheath gpL-like
VFNNPLLYPALTAQVVKGLVVYHILGTRAFSVNLPATATSVPTLLNSAIAAHPGVSVTATFTGPFVTGATVKGLGNPTASTILINPTPAPGGTSDQHYLNGVLHKINQVLRPQ